MIYILEFPLSEVIAEGGAIKIIRWEGNEKTEHAFVCGRQGLQ
jgi:hypothetical protein